MAPSEWKRIGEDTGAGQATGHDTDEVKGVDLDAFASGALAELAAGGSFQDELERLAVDAGPFSYDVGDEATIVVGGQVHGPVDRLVQIDTMAPHVTGETDVEQVL